MMRIYKIRKISSVTPHVFITSRSLLILGLTNYDDCPGFSSYSNDSESHYRDWIVISDPSSFIDRDDRGVRQSKQYTNRWTLLTLNLF